MFDGLRKDASDSSGFDEQQVDFFPEEKKPAPARSRKRKSNLLLGMSPKQRFLIAVMIMIMVCTLGSACMVVSGSFVF